MHGLGAPVDVASCHQLPKDAQLGCLILGLQGQVWPFPVAPDTIPAPSQQKGVRGGSESMRSQCRGFRSQEWWQAATSFSELAWCQPMDLSEACSLNDLLCLHGRQKLCPHIVGNDWHACCPIRATTGEGTS